MSARDGGSEGNTATCRACGDHVDECVVCEERSCDAPVCFTCLNVTLRQAEPAVHGHGG